MIATPNNAPPNPLAQLQRRPGFLARLFRPLMRAQSTDGGWNYGMGYGYGRYGYRDTPYTGASWIRKQLSNWLPIRAAADAELLSDMGTLVARSRDLDRNRKDDYVAAWTASVQRKLPFNVLGTAAYLGNKATDILTTTYVNRLNPLTGVAPYPAFGPVSWRGNVGNSTFHALQLNLRRAFQKGY